MEKIGVVIFLGLVMSTIAQASPQRPNFLDRCQSVQEKSGFNKEQFFSGEWFITHARDTDDTLLCYKYTTLVNSEGKLEVQHRYFKESKERKVICTQKDGKSQVPYTFNCEVKEGEETTHEFEVQHTIVETDGNSALLYRCRKVGNLYTDNFLVLNRQQNGEVSEDVKNAISTQSLNFGKFLSRSSVTCRP